jgi:uncharacterized repeat protein (TIGR03803 family)
MLRLCHNFIGFGLAVSVAGCSGSSTAFVPREFAQHRVVSRSAEHGYLSLYSFKGIPDGATPLWGSLAVLNGNLYGTTQEGGDQCDYPPDGLGCGTVFAVTPTGAESVVYAFKGDKAGCDGEDPWGGVTASNGTLYGATSWGGCTYGTVFSLTPSGSEDVLFRFSAYAQGAIPVGTLIPTKGKLYGTTQSGGHTTCSCGTVFDVATSGKERPVYEFKGRRNGDAPNGIVAVGNRFYGTTEEGGRNGLGAIFATDASGKERELYSFKGGPDGWFPQANLIAMKGVLYGTTLWGGEACSASGLGCGTVFAVDLNGKEKVIYRFKGGNDGIGPTGVLADVNGGLYGTTQDGGGTACHCGTVFKVTTSGKEQLMYSFEGSPDGASPWAGLTLFNGKLYGTTAAGGTCSVYGAGCGTIFEINP